MAVVDASEAKGSQPQGVLQPERAAAHFTLERRRPAADLADYVDRHWIVRWDLGSSGPFTQEILPHPCVNIVSEPGLIAVWGIPTEVSPHRLEGQGTAVGTKFLPGAFCALAGGSARELNGRHVPLGAVLGELGDELQVQLESAADDPDRQIAAVEAAVRRLTPPDPRLELVRAATRTLLDGRTSVTVAEVAASLAVSERTLQRAFRELVGVGPKWVARRYRMHEAAERHARGEAADLATLAHELGYFDQAHFTSDFRRQIGSSPARYARMCAAAAGRAG
jgi:AraC-like DNA-binding protein